jgi:hypothetical protein
MNNSIAFWEREAGRQREIITTYSNIPIDQIQVMYLIQLRMMNDTTTSTYNMLTGQFLKMEQGFRTPYLQTGGDATFTALQNLGINFDSSLSTKNFMDPPIWPFTMDYGVTHVRLYLITPISLEEK